MRQPSRAQGGQRGAPNASAPIDQQQQQQQQLAKMQSPLEHLQEARRVKSNSGKLLLAAIVHYDSRLPTDSARPDDCDKNQEPLLSGAVGVAGEQQVTGDTYERPSRRLGKFARLFSVRAKKRAEQSQQRKMDELDDNEKCEAERANEERSAHRATSAAGVMDRLELQTGWRRGDCTGTPECQPPVGESRRERKVIEFKFDLIVEGQEDEQLELTGSGLGSASPAPPPTSHQAEKILRPITQRKLLDQVNDLVEAFVLDSLDGCLMSAGRRHLASSGPAQFDYSLALAKFTLTYAFQLLQAAKEQASGDQRALNYLSGRPSPCAKIEAYSIELEATLFGTTGSDHSLEISDLLCADVGALEGASGASVGAISNRKLECHGVDKALEVLQLIRSNLALKTNIRHAKEAQNKQVEEPNCLLMICLKLKQVINGGSFTNRLCLLDLAEPAASELSSIFGAIFSGRALGRLKREKVHLRSLEMQLDLMRRTHERAESCASGPTAREQFECTQEFRNKHHRIASLARLIQAQWLIYKQLSAALIKSLIIVHCHRSRLKSAQRAPPDLSRLMAYNLGLLEFARTLQKGSSSRLRRRRRHLRSHMSSATNLSFVSDTNLSINLSDEEASTSNELSKQLDKHDLMIAPPLRLARSPWAGRRRAACSDCFDDDDDDDELHSHYDLTATPLSTRSRLSHHQRRVHRSRSGSGRHHQSHHHGHNRHEHYRHDGAREQRCGADHWAHRDDQLSLDSSYRVARASSLSGRHRQCELGGGGGGSLASSETSHLGCHYSSKIARLIGSQRQLLQQPQPDQKHGAPSDTEDSLASANLNSCSSQSMRDRQKGGDLHKLLKVMQKGGSREEELRWLKAAAGKLQMARKHSSALDTASESTSIDSPSIELQSFCSANSTSASHRPRRALQTVSPPAGAETQERRAAALQTNEDRSADNASDICSMVAEPPRQLKLEEFLNQLSSAIGPDQAAREWAAKGAAGCGDSTATNESSVNATRLAAGRLDHEDDEDEDCKSHSSILEHLSSLTMESNLRLQLQNAGIGEQATLGQYRRQPASARVNIVEECGHLQRLLKSTLQMHSNSALERSYQQERLRALSIDCDSDGDGSRATRPADSSSAHLASDSSASGSSSSSSADQNGTSSGPESLPQSHVPSPALNQLYSSVIRQHT